MIDFRLARIVSAMKKLLWAERPLREHLQAHGLNLVPANFYSNIPSVAEVNESFEYVDGRPPYLDEGLFNKDFLRSKLEDLIPFANDFSPPKEGDENTCKSFFWGNSQFSWSDAPAYWAFLRKERPANVVEIGSGFSSLIALEALEANGRGSLHCIEPYPRPFISELGEERRLKLHKAKAQDVHPDTLNEILSDGDVLFIDSTHTVKSGSDCLHIYLRLLPKIRRNILVHVHDVFLPFGLPKQWLLDMHIYWTEQYLMQAWLIDNPKIKVVFGSAYHTDANLDRLTELGAGRHPPGGSSFWFELDGRKGTS